MASVQQQRKESYVSRYFDAAGLSGLEQMRFTPRRTIEGHYSGRHLSRRRGGSGVFVDYREYSPGDDVRRIDWKAMGRMGRAYLKMFQDDTDLNCTLVLDSSGSMGQGNNDSPYLSKLEWMKYFATALSHLIVFGRDAAGLAVVQQGLMEFMPPSSSMQSRQLMHHKIEELTSDGETQLAQGLDDLLIRIRQRGVVLILSDFLVDSMDELVAGVRKFRARGCEVVAIHLIHPDEQDLPEGNAFRFVGLEGEGIVNCQLAEVRKAYQQRFEELVVTTRQMLTSAGCDYLAVSTKESYLDVLRSFLVVRGA